MILIILLIYFLFFLSNIYSELAQLAEHLTVNQVVAGSSPAFGAKKNPRPSGLRVLFLFGSVAGLFPTTSYLPVGALKNELSEVGRRPRKTIEYCFSTGVN